MKRGLFLFVLAVIFLLPPAVLFIYGFAASWSYPQLLPDSFSLRAWELVTRQGSGVAVSLLSSGGYSIAAVGVTLLLCYFPASALAYSSFRGKGILEKPS